MIDPWPKLQLLLRAELLRVRISTRLALTRAWHFAVGVILALAAVAMFALAGFVWLEEQLGPVTAALVTGGALLVAALIVIVSGYRMKPGPEAALVDDLEDLARAGLRADLAHVERILTRPFGAGEGLTAQLSLLLGILNALLSRTRQEPASEDPGT